jgi:hypothetical protein
MRVGDEDGLDPFETATTPATEWIDEQTLAGEIDERACMTDPGYPRLIRVFCRDSVLYTAEPAC